MFWVHFQAIGLLPWVIHEVYVKYHSLVQIFNISFLGYWNSLLTGLLVVSLTSFKSTLRVAEKVIFSDFNIFHVPPGNRIEFKFLENNKQNFKNNNIVANNYVLVMMFVVVV